MALEAWRALLQYSTCHWSTKAAVDKTYMSGAWLYSNTTLFTNAGTGPNLACGLQFTEPWTRTQKNLNKAVRLEKAQILFPGVESDPGSLQVRPCAEDWGRINWGLLWSDRNMETGHYAIAKWKLKDSEEEGITVKAEPLDAQAGSDYCHCSFTHWPRLGFLQITSYNTEWWITIKCKLVMLLPSLNTSVFSRVRYSEECEFFMWYTRPIPHPHQPCRAALLPWHYAFAAFPDLTPVTVFA